MPEADEFVEIKLANIRYATLETTVGRFITDYGLYSFKDTKLLVLQKNSVSFDMRSIKLADGHHVVLDDDSMFACKGDGEWLVEEVPPLQKGESIVSISTGGDFVVLVCFLSFTYSCLGGWSVEKEKEKVGLASSMEFSRCGFLLNDTSL